MKKIFLLQVLFLSSVVKAQLIQTADKIANTAELVSITADVINSTLETKDKVKEIEQDLKDIASVVNSAEYSKYCSQDGKSQMLTEISYKARKVQMYALFLKSTTEILGDLRENLIRLKAEEAKNSPLGDKLKEGISKSMESIKEIPVVGKVANGVAGIFGVSAEDGQMQPVVAAIEKAETSQKKTSFEDRLVNFLYDLERFNENLDRLRIEVKSLKYTVSAQMTFGLMGALPYSTVRDYAYRRNIELK